MYVSYIQQSRRERRERLVDLLGIGSGTVDTPSYTSRVVKIPFSEALILSISYTAVVRLPTYIRLVSTISSTL